MFLENDYARPLFDFYKGGKAKAFQCLMPLNNNLDDGPCEKVTRTERGMRMHLKIVHNWKEQPCLYSMESQTDRESGKPRKLRAGPPVLKNENAQPDTEKIPHSPRKPPETKEGGLLKLMKEGN